MHQQSPSLSARGGPPGLDVDTRVRTRERVRTRMRARTAMYVIARSPAVVAIDADVMRAIRRTFRVNLPRPRPTTQTASLNGSWRSLAAGYNSDFRGTSRTLVRPSPVMVRNAYVDVGGIPLGYPWGVKTSSRTR